MKTSSIFFMVCFALLITIQVDAQIGSIITPSSDSYVEGDFGIGHNNPILPLHIKTSGSSTARFETTGTSGNIVDFRENGTRKAIFWLEADDDFKIRSEVGDLIFQTSGNTDRMTILNSGNVGVGTPSPLARLHVNTTGSDMARFESSASSKYISFYQGSTRRGFLWSTGSDMILVSDGGDVKFRTSAVNRMTIEPSGEVGVGTESPLARFHVSTTGSEISRFESSASSKWISFYQGNIRKGLLWSTGNDMALVSDSGNVKFRTNGANRMTIEPSGQVGIGTESPDRQLHIIGGTDATLAGGGYLQIGTTGGDNLAIDANEILARSNAASATMFIQKDAGDLLLCGNELGQVGIGVTSSGNMPDDEYLLAVDGKIASEELLVELSGGWPDYVFEKTYELKTLEEVEASIMKNGHLPGIPSATEVEETGGIHVGDMQTRTMEKVEELTLYAIDANKKIKTLNQENQDLKNTLEILIKRIEQLEIKN